MAHRKVLRYKLSWNQKTKLGQVWIDVEGGANGTDGHADNLSADEFAALAAVLQEPNVYLMDDKSLESFPPKSE